MAKPIPLDFGTGSDPGRDGGAGPVHTNCFVEPVAESGKQAPLRACDGLSTFATLTSNGRVRGLHVMGQYLYAVSGTQLHRVDRDGRATVIGGVPGAGRVIMSRNDTTIPQLSIVTDEGERYVATEDTVAAIGDLDLPAPVYTTYLNQRTLYGIGDGRVFFSAVDDATSIDPLDVFTAEGNPDGIVAVVAHLQEAWCFGRESIEIWRNVDTSFVRNEAGVIPRGALSKYTIRQINEHLFWVGDDYNVYQSRGYGSAPVANFSVLEAIRKSAADSLEACSFKAWGHDFYVLSGTETATERRWTWAYNVSTGKWDPRESYGDTRWRVTDAVQFSGMIIVGSYDSGITLYRLDRDAHDEAGSKLVWRARTAPMHAYPQQMSVDRLYLDLITGVGDRTGTLHQTNPQVGLRWSDDGGDTWSNQELRALGATGNRFQRVTFDALGTTEPGGRIWEVEISSPVVRVLSGAAVEGDILST
jgi:hypothetical protein